MTEIEVLLQIRNALYAGLFLGLVGLFVKLWQLANKL